MTTKEIYESIDQSKISKEGKKFLMDVEEGTKGFTKQNDKVDKALLNLYKKLKEKKPEALKNLKTKTVEKSVSVPTTKAERKKEPKKETKKVTKKVVEASGTKKNTKPTKTPSTPKKGKQEHISTRASKLAKKEGITFKQARAKLSKEAKEDFKKEKKETDSELDKLLKFVRKGKFEDGEKYPKIYGKQDKGKSSVSADAKRMAKPVGKRVSKNGKTYYEYRDNRSDRNSLPAPKGQYKYKGETPPFLEAGGTLPTPFGQAGLVGETGTLNEVDLFAMGGGLPQGVHQYYANTYNPAYPTPHGYAEGGETEVRYTEDELKYALGVDDDYEDWVELAFQRGYKYDESKDEWYLPNDYAKGGALKGSNRSTGESYGVVVGSKEVMEDGDVFINVRTGYNSRISESKLKFNNGNIEEITDYGYTLDGSMPDLSAGSGKGYNATTKAETIKVLSKLYNPSFAKKLIEYSKEKFADGGKIQISEVYNVNGKDYLFSTPIQNDKGTYTGWDAYEVVYDTFDGEKHLNYTKTKRGKSKYFPNGVKRTEAEDYFAKGGEVVGLHISRLHSDFPKGFENSGEVIKKGNNKFKVENGILLIKMGSSDWKEWRKITYAKGGKIDTSKKGVYLMELKDGTFKVSNNLGDRDFPYEFNDVFPTKERAMKFANRVAKNSKSKVVEIKYANGGKMKQGYNDRLDESLGNRNSVEPLMMQSYTDRRDESKGMEKSMGRRAYQSVGSMDKMAKGGKVNLNKLSDETYRMGEIDKKHSKRLFEISDDLADLDLGNKTYAKGGRLSTSDRYVLELAGLTGLRKNAIEELVKDNSLTESELLNIIVGVGRQQIKSSVVVSAVMDGVNSKANTNLVKFAKSEKAMRLDKGGEIDAFIMKFVKDAPASNLRVDAEELTAKLKKGGKLGFDGLANKVAKRYVGKPVKGKFQSEYGKTYSKAEAMEVGKKVAGKVYRQQQGMEAGGTLPTPFGQAGLVGETGTLNEVDLFAMGGGLPQGVQQYYGQTYNPAYPTPHGYAKGGAILKPRNKRKGDIGNRDKKVKVDTIYGDRAMKVIYYDLKGNPEKEEIVSYESGLERIKFDNLFSGIFDDYSRNNKAHYVFYRNDNKSHRDRKVVYLETKMYAKGGKIKFDDSSMMKKLWNERGFDIPYLESLSDSELKGLYDSEFDDERTYNFKTNRDEISNDYAKGGKTQGGKFYSVVTLISSKKRSKGDIQESMKMFVEQSKKQGYIKSVSVFDSYKGNPSNTDGMRAEVLVDYVDVQMLLNFASLFNLKYDSHKNYKKSDGKLAFAKGGKTQGYNDKLDESLGNTKGKRSTKEQNYKDRRNESEAMENKGGKRKYSRVNTMDKMAKGGATSVDTSDVVFFAYEEMMKKNKKFKSEEELYDFVNEGYAFPKYSKKAVKTAFKSLSEDFYAKGGKTQGYNDKLDESLGNTKGKRSTKEQNYKDRRNESEAMEKKGGKRKYASVKTMDKGNRSKRKTPMSLAKEIRKEGEKWQDAVKRASAMLKKV